jgi:hypothetical protein
MHKIIALIMLGVMPFKKSMKEDKTMRRTKLNFTLLFLLVSVSVVYIGCGVIPETVRKTIYVNFRKAPIDTTIVVSLPKIELPSDTKQTQVKGGVSVFCELVPFDIERTEHQERNITYSDVPGYDIYEVAKEPVYIINPNELQFKIRVKNNQDRVLKLIDVPIILIVDGIQTSIPTDHLIEWQSALIVKGFEKEFMLLGPELGTLFNAKVIYIAIDDVPVLYDQAGNVSKKENFEWTFYVKKDEVPKQDKIVYAYETEPIYKEPCKACAGKGYFEHNYKCSVCGGSGVLTDKKGNTHKCYNCKGTGRETVKEKCTACNGQGVIEYPKSSKPPVEREVIWKGWKVRIESNPPGATVSVVDLSTEEYKNVGVTNVDVRWFSSSSKSYPIIVEYQGKQIKVLPFTPDGKESDKVVIDFLSGPEPSVSVGRKVE